MENIRFFFYQVQQKLLYVLHFHSIVVQINFELTKIYQMNKKFVCFFSEFVFLTPRRTRIDAGGGI